MPSRTFWRWTSKVAEPRPARLPAASPGACLPGSGAAGFVGPEVPRRITGAEKLMLGMLGGG